jgi:predicted component of type VI protein secretion system
MLTSIAPKPNFSQPTQPQTLHTKPPNISESPQFGMPTSLSPITQPRPSLSFHPNNPNTSSTPNTLAFFQATNTYTQPIPHYTQQPYPYYNQYPQTYSPQLNQQWPRPIYGWSDQPHLQTPQPPNTPNTTQTHDHSFAHSFSKGIKLEFPRFDGDIPIGWLRQAEKCFALTKTPIDRRVKFEEVFFIGKAGHWLRSSKLNTDNLS